MTPPSQARPVRPDDSRPDRLGQVVRRMAEAATDWLASLAPPQRAKAAHGFPESRERTRWHYTPTEQGGLPLAEMDPVQQRLAHRLIASGLSHAGYVAVCTVMGLENVLDAVEGWRHGYPGRAAPSRYRDPQLYWLTVFGDPASGTWGWRAGGHHVAVNQTIVGGRRLAVGPLFLGANPATSPLVGSGVLRPLAGEEDLGRQFLHALTGEQRAAATLTREAPPDILQANRAQVDPAAMEPKGLAAAEMTPAQRELLLVLVHQYLGRLPDEVAAVRAERIAAPAADLHFAWAGGAEPGEPHYYRVQGDRLLIEYDNTQNRVNHVHSVLRDPVGDFGADLLAGDEGTR
jgi:Protein of unknown function (DUF3500)